MAGIWSRKFDYKNGEDRVCKICGDAFHTIKPKYRCKKCVNDAQRPYEEAKRLLYNKKQVYPFNTMTNEAGSRFCSIRTKLTKVWKEYSKHGDKSVITAHYDRQLKEIEENGILKWIYDRRDLETLKAKQIKTRNQMQKEYPSTIGYYGD